MKRRGFLWSAAALLAARQSLAERLAQGLPTSQQAPPQPIQTPPPFRVEVDVDIVSVTAVIFDKAGRFVRGLSEKDVELFEDNVKQELTYFREAAGGDETSTRCRPGAAPACTTRSTTRSGACATRPAGRRWSCSATATTPPAAWAARR
jgi:hypothetical protein